MAADVETMFYTREKPWHGLGVEVADALSSAEALAASGLDWKVVQKEILTEDGAPVPGFKANVRDSDEKVLGIVSDRYRVVQNEEAFAFTDKLLGEGVRYETAGSLNGGEEKYGCWQGCPGSTSCSATASAPTWSSPTRTTEAGRSAWR